MANENIKVISDREDIVAIADNIRSLTGITGELTLAEMATAKGSGGGVSLPSLANPGTKEDLMLNKELIDGNGNKVTGTFTIDEEVDTQTDLISQIKTKVNGLPNAGSGELTLQDKTVTPTTSSQTITADSGYDGLDTVTVNAMPTATQATPSITVNSSGLITVSATQTAGYVSAGTKSATKQLTTKSATTITPTTSEQVAVSAGTYVTGDVKVAAASSSGGGNIEAVVGTIGASGPALGSTAMSGMVYYIDENGTYCTTNVFGQINVMKDSILVATSDDGVSMSGEAVTIINNYGNPRVFHITGNFTVKI